MRLTALCALGASTLLVAGCAGEGGQSVKGAPPKAPATMLVASPAFQNGGAIPKRFSCDGGDHSPPLRISRAPAKAKELALLVEDPGTRGGTFVHWSAWAIPPATRAIAEDGLPSGAIEGQNSFGDKGYEGPCPPKSDDPHHYRFIVYALSSPLGLDAGAKPKDVRAAIAERALARGETVGTFGR